MSLDVSNLNEDEFEKMLCNLDINIRIKNHEFKQIINVKKKIFEVYFQKV